MAISIETETISTEVIHIPAQEVFKLDKITAIIAVILCVSTTGSLMFIWYSHTMLGTFLICCSLVLLMVGSYMIDSLHDKLKEKHGWTGAYPHRVEIVYSTHMYE